MSTKIEKNAEQLIGLARALVQIAMRLESMAESATEAAESGADEGAMASEMERTAKMAEGILGQLAPLAKAGAKMAGSRRDRFKRALEKLLAIASELGVSLELRKSMSDEIIKVAERATGEKIVKAFQGETAAAMLAEHGIAGYAGRAFCSEVDWPADLNVEED